MNFIKKTMYIIGLGFIALFLFVTHAKLLYFIDPGKDSDLFKFFGYDVKRVIPYIFGAAFGVVTTIIIALIDKKDKMFWYFVIVVAAFELIGVFTYNNTTLSDFFLTGFTSTYYATYTAFIVIMYAYISASNAMQDATSNAKGFDLTGFAESLGIHDKVLKTSHEGVTFENSFEAKKEFYEKEIKPELIRSGVPFDNPFKRDKEAFNNELDPDQKYDNKTYLIETEPKHVEKFDPDSRNYQIVKMDAAGDSRQDIAERFDISESTVSRVISKSKK